MPMPRATTLHPTSCRHTLHGATPVSLCNLEMERRRRAAESPFAHSGYQPQARRSSHPPRRQRALCPRRPADHQIPTCLHTDKERLGLWRSLGFASLRFSTLGSSRHVDGLFHPYLQLIHTLHYIGRNFVIAHCAIFAEWPERLHPALLKVGACRIIHFKIQPVLSDEGEEQSLGLDSNTAEH